MDFFVKDYDFYFLVLHGPNLNLLGEREPQWYGTMTLGQVNAKLRFFARKNRTRLFIHQSNSEGALIDFLHFYRKKVNGVIFNPAAYTHTSYALRDAVSAILVPTIEVHLSPIAQRESFRKISVIAPVCWKQISGYGWKSYTQAMRAHWKRLRVD